MFFKHSKNGVSPCDAKANGVISRFPESPVNPMYKLRTLGELRALFEHTGINPAPVALRDGIKEVEGLDPMDTPPIPIGGDRFESIRIGQALENDLRDKIDAYRANQKEEPKTDASDKVPTQQAD